ncbi:MAG: hypothetical protein ABI995_07385 [Acidobacteriota bacterium]
MKRILALLAFSAAAAFAQTPTVTQILNNYSLINAGQVAQGAIFIVKGSNLADTEAGLQNTYPLQTTLNGVRMRITVNGTTTFAIMYYALKIQLAGILPSNTPQGIGTLVVEVNGRVSASATITVTKSGFGNLTASGDGSGSARVQDANQGYQELSSIRATNPGNFLVFYGSGVGATKAGVDESVPQLGANASGDLTSISITVTIGGKNAEVFYRGRTAFPGLDQINVKVPTLDTGAYSCTVVVAITTNNVDANITTIPVAPSGSTCTTQSNNGGGNSGNVNPTSAEINTWSTRGNYAFGTLNLDRSTVYAIDTFGTTATTKADTYSGTFATYSGSDVANVLRGILPTGYPNLTPTVGSCVVYNIKNIFNPYPNLSLTSLDAGPQINVTGPNGAQVAPRSSIQNSGFSYGSTNIPITYLAPGSYTLTGPGGANVGSFSGGLSIAQEFVVTNSPSEFTTINRGSGFTVRWTGGDNTTVLTISGVSVSLDVGTGATSGAAFTCLQNTSAGSFTVPSSILSQLPASSVISSDAFNLITRGSFSVSARGAGSRFATPSGLDILTAINTWNWTYAPQYK